MIPAVAIATGSNSGQIVAVSNCVLSSASVSASAIQANDIEALTGKRFHSSEPNVATSITETNSVEARVGKDFHSSDSRVQVEEAEQWNYYKRGRFNILARLEALRPLSIQEQIELEKLTKLRRAENHPRSADEILWQRKQRKLTESLVTALKEYVDFHEAPNNS